jgi:hypothetical protein
MGGTMGPPDRAQLAAAAARKQKEQRKKYDPALRASYIHQGKERPADEFLGLGVVVREGKAFTWSTTVVCPRAARRSPGGHRRAAEDQRRSQRRRSHRGPRRNLGSARPCPQRHEAVRYVVFPDRTLHQTLLGDKKVASRVQEDVLRFNALAETARKTDERN